MHPPHPALPWPAVDPEELSRIANDLRLLSATVAGEVLAWRISEIDWSGRAARSNESESDRIRAHAKSIHEAPLHAALTIERLEQALRSTIQDIGRLAETVHAAESHARSQQAVADRATRAAALATYDPASFGESERLHQVAILERSRAALAAREADAVLRRAIGEAAELVAAVDRHERVTAHQLDSMLEGPHPTMTERPALNSPTRVPLDDRSWITAQIARTTLAIQNHVDALTRAVAEIEAVPWAERTWWESMALVHLTEQIELHSRFLSAERQMLEWNPTGDGRAVEVFGDPTTARHIAVVVPGIMNTIDNFDDHLAADARELWSQAATRDARTAVIAWLGYDTPELLNAVSKGRAVEYEPELRSFIDSLPAGAHVTVVAHSYGTVLTGEAASRGLSADDVVLVGSPGTRLEHATDADLEPGAQVFAGVSDSDYLVGRTGYGSIVCPEKALGVGLLTGLRWVVSPITGPLSWVTDSCNTDADGDVKGLSHGINPAHEDFGAIEISTDGVGGHSSYFDAGSSSLEAIAQIVTGSHPEQR